VSTLCLFDPSTVSPKYYALVGCDQLVRALLWARYRVGRQRLYSGRAIMVCKFKTPFAAAGVSAVERSEKWGCGYLPLRVRPVAVHMLVLVALDLTTGPVAVQPITTIPRCCPCFCPRCCPRPRCRSYSCPLLLSIGLCLLAISLCKSLTSRYRPLPSQASK